MKLPCDKWVKKLANVPMLALPFAHDVFVMSSCAWDRCLRQVEVGLPSAMSVAAAPLPVVIFALDAKASASVNTLLRDLREMLTDDSGYGGAAVESSGHDALRMRPAACVNVTAKVGIRTTC
jgi:hypothetical protein